MISGYALLSLKRNLHLWLTCTTVLVCAVAVVESRQARRLVEKPLIIAIDANGTRLVSHATDPIFETEVTQFMRMFVGKLYNFTPATYRASVGEATTFMALALFEAKKSEIESFETEVNTASVSLTGKITRLEALEDGSFRAQIDTVKLTRLQKIERSLSVVFQLKRVPRTELNPWGIEVTDYDESVVN